MFKTVGMVVRPNLNPIRKNERVRFKKRSPDNSTSVLCVLRARRYAYGKIRDSLFKYFTPKLGIEQMNRVPGKIEI